MVSGVWYDVGEGPNTTMGLIYVDALDAAGMRQTGVSIRIRNLAGVTLQDLRTEAKPGEPYAANFIMGLTAPAYSAQPLNAPADAVYYMGLGSLDGSNSTAPTGYGLVWQWTIAGGASATPTPTPTPTPSPTLTPTPSPTGSPTPSPTPTATYLFSSFSVPACRPQAGGTWFSGVLTLQGQPANGYRVVYSSAPDRRADHRSRHLGPARGLSRLESRLLQPHRQREPGHRRRLVRLDHRRQRRAHLGDRPLAFLRAGREPVQRRDRQL